MAPSDFDDVPKKRTPLFWWLLANILAVSFAITSWIVCLNLFRDPTNPTSYKLMLKVGRLESPKAFSPLDTPVPLKDSDPKELEAQFQSFSQTDLETLNKELRRAYLSNFKKPKFLTYVTGEYRIIGVEKLTEEDFLSPGIVVKAQAMIRPDAVAAPLPYPVFLECLFPSEDATPESFQLGNILTLKKQRECAAILNIGATAFENRKTVFVTVVPLAAVEHTTASGATFTITPPAMANPEASLPAYP